MTQVFHTGGPVENHHPKAFSGALHVPQQRFVQRIVTIDQHAVVIVFLEPRFDASIEVSEQSADLTTSFDFKHAAQTVPVTVQIAALVLQSLIAVSRVKLVLLFDQHLNVSVQNNFAEFNER